MHQYSLPFSSLEFTTPPIRELVQPKKRNARAASFADRNIELSNIWRDIPFAGNLQFFGDSDYFPAHDHARVHCTDCGFGDHHEYAGKFHNISRLEKGCPICSVTGPMLKRAREFWQSAIIEVEYVEGKAIDIKSIIYKLTWSTNPYEPDRDVLRVNHEQLKDALNKHIPIHKFFANKGIRKKYDEADSVLKEFRALFKRGTIELIENLPEPRYRFDTGKSRSAAHKRQVEGEATEIRVKEIIREERKGQARIIDYKKKFGGQNAKFLGTCRELVGDEVKLKVVYKNYQGKLRKETITRVHEFNFGKTHLRKGESLCYMCVKALFPSGKWERTVRPEFLRLGNSSILELDINSEKLRMAFEYQGAHHYRPVGKSEKAKIDFAIQVKHDEIKRERCANHPEGPYTLIEIKDQTNGHELTPSEMLRNIKEQLARTKITPENPEPSIEAIETEYLAYFEQPYREFQETVRENLGVHELLDCTLADLYPNKRIRTRCTACNKLQPETNASAFYYGSPRLNCKSCGGKERHQMKRMTKIDTLIKRGKLKEKYRDRFILGEHGRIQYVCLDNEEHTHSIHSGFTKWLKTYCKDGEITCIRCVNEASGVHVSRVHLKESEEESFAEKAKLMGFDTDETTFKYEDFFGKKTLCGTVICQQDSSHQFKSGLSHLNEISKLRRKEVRPSGFACPTCTPGTTCSVAAVNPPSLIRRPKVMSGAVLKDEIVKAMYPQAIRKSLGNARDEESVYWCGHSHSDGRPHVDFDFKFHNLQKRAKRRSSHMCFTCGYLADERGGLGYSLENVEDLARADQHRLREKGLKFDADVKVLEIPNPPSSRPKVKRKKDGSLAKPEQWYSFWCGIHGHTPVKATKSNFFNRTQGGRWCKECLASIGLKRLPPRNKDGAESAKFGKLKQLQIVKRSKSS